jgi:hypothetical protein
MRIVQVEWTHGLQFFNLEFAAHEIMRARETGAGVA